MVTVAKSSTPNTLQSKMGFTDPDLKTAGHDAIMLWLNDNVRQISLNILGLTGAVGQWKESYLRELYEPLRANFEEWWADRSHPSVEIGKVVWEHPVTTGAQNKYTVGFIDLQLEISHSPVLRRSQDWWNPGEGDPFFTYWKKTENLLFEVKTTIPSLGELIRQIRYYQEYEQGIYVVVSPDARWKAALESQDIRFVLADGQPIQAKTP